MIIAAAFAAFAVAVLFGVLARPVSQSRRRVRVAATSSWLCCALGSVLATVAGGQAVGGSPEHLGLGELAGLGPAVLHADRLSGLFLIITFGVAAPATIAAARHDADRPRLPGAIAMALAAALVVITADHLFVLIFGWETLTFAFYLLAGFDRDEPGRATASVAAAGFGKMSGAALLVGGTVLAGRAGTFTIAQLSPAGGAAAGAGAIAYALLLFGFATKVGVAPVQVWLPPAYSGAPPAARAIMAGAAVNVGFYGMWRTLQVLGHAPVWLAVAVLVTGGLTAILGIAHAAVHPRLTGLVSWSSVENAGVITAAFGVALMGSAAHNGALTAAGLVAATAQVIAHALGKSLLFIAAAQVERTAGTTRLDALQGIARRYPAAGFGLVVGSLTLAGLPLTAGFASEWLVLEALMQQFRVPSLPMQLAAAFAGALVALTVGVAGLTFVRLVAFTAFGPPQRGLRGSSGGPGLALAVGALAAGSLGVAAVAPLEVRLIGDGLRPVVGNRGFGALAQPWVIQPVFAHFSALSPSWMWIALPALTLAAVGVAVLLAGRRLFTIRRVPAWTSASAGVSRGSRYTSFAYANPIRRVLANLLLTKSELAEVESAQHRLPPRSGPSEPEAAAADSELGLDDTIGVADAGRAAILHYRVDVVEVVERYLYRPAAVVLLGVARLSRRLQSGRLDAYMAYMLLALVAVLAVVTATV